MFAIFSFFAIILTFFAMAPLATQNSQSSPQGLEGLWRLDEGVGEVVKDISRNNRHGKVTRAKWIASKDGKAFALEFDGLLSFVDIPGDAFQFRDELTIMAWVNPSDLSAEGAIVSLGREHPSSGYHLIHGPNGALKFLLATERRPRVGGGAVFTISTKPILQVGKWTHLTVTYSVIRDEVVIYSDGEPVSKSKSDGKIAYYAVWGIQYPPLTIGDRSHEKRFWSFDGFIRNVRIYSRALSHEEILAIFFEEAPQIRELQFLPSRQKIAHLPCRLSLEIVDETTGKPTPAKVFITDSDGNGYYPPEAFEKGLAYGLLERRKAFYTGGNVTVPLHEGTFTVEATKGYEFLPTKAIVTLKDGEEKQLRLILRRLVDMRQLGWVSGEHHLHCTGHGVQKYDRVFADPKLCLATLSLILKAEGFHYAFMVPHGLKFGETYAEPEFLLHASGEWGSGGTGGDICLIGFKELPRRRNIFDNIAAFFMAKERGWVALHTHPDWGRIENPKDLGFARDLPIVVAYGWSPVWDLFCWTANEEKLKWWYSWLNLGFKLGITGGTDTYFNNPRNIISPGRNRTYVRTKNVSLEDIIDGYRSGHTFATSGPLIVFQVRPADAKREWQTYAQWAEVGDTVELVGKKPQNLEINLHCFSSRGLGRVEIVRNGEVVWAANCNGEVERKYAINLAVDRTCWLAARCLENWAKDPKNGFAHTSPIYIQFEDKPMVPKDEDISFFVRWLENYESVLPIVAKELGAKEDEYAELIWHIRKAREIYLSLRSKPRHWKSK